MLMEDAGPDSRDLSRSIYLRADQLDGKRALMTSET
jgi:hypothetical protein